MYERAITTNKIENCWIVIQSKKIRMKTLVSYMALTALYCILKHAIKIWILILSTTKIYLQALN